MNYRYIDVDDSISFHILFEKIYIYCKYRYITQPYLRIYDFRKYMVLRYFNHLMWMEYSKQLQPGMISPLGVGLQYSCFIVNGP